MRSVAVFLFLLAVIASARADNPGVVSKEEIAARYSGLSPADIHEAPVEGFYEIAVGTRVTYITHDGRYLFQGDIIQLADEQNLTETRRAQNRAAAIAAVAPETEIVFAPKNGVAKHRIYIFTDMDCGYCRQFHRDIAAVNALGIEVYYLSYPRTGPNTDSWAKAEGVWCAADRKAALTRAKLGADVPAVPGCTAKAVGEHYELGRKIAITGTPAIYSESGVELGGYLPPNELALRLEFLDEPQALAPTPPK